MTWYIAKRVLGTIPTLLVIVTAVFVLLRLIPGNPVTELLPDTATAAQIKQLTHHLGLDQPIPVQYGDYLLNLLHLDFGNSIRFDEPVSDLIATRLPATIELAIAAAIVAIVIGIPLGVLAGRFHGTWIDRVASVLGLVGISAPSFWIGILLIIYIGGGTGWFPTGGQLPGGVEGTGPTGLLVVDMLIHGNFSELGVVLQYLALPAITLGLAMSGMLVRMTRSSLMEVSDADYVRTARAKGVPGMRVLWGHSMRNAALPIVTVLGMELASLLSGSVIVETVFAWPGMGSLLITSVEARDYPVIEACIIVFALFFILCNLLVDISYSFIDPRIRF